MSGTERRMQREKGKLKAPEFDRVVLKQAGDIFPGKPFAARREGLEVSDHVSLAAGRMRMRRLFVSEISSDDPKAAGMLVFRSAYKCISAGKRPAQAALSFVFPAAYDEKKMRAYFSYAKAAAGKAGLIISDIDIERNEIPVAHIGVSVCGEEGNSLKAAAGEKVKAGPKTTGEKTKEQYLVMISYPGKEGSILLRDACSGLLEEKYPRHFLDTEELYDSLYNKELAEAILSDGGQVFSYLNTIGDGGIFGALWSLAEQTHLGMRVELDKIRLDSLTIEICETLDISPYELLGGGALLGITAEPEAAVAVCAGAEAEAFVIGVLEKGNDRLIVNGDEKRYLEPFRHDSLYTIV